MKTKFRFQIQANGAGISNQSTCMEVASLFYIVYAMADDEYPSGLRRHNAGNHVTGINIPRYSDLSTRNSSGASFGHRSFTLYILKLKKKHKHLFTISIIPPHWHDTGSYNPFSWKTRTGPFYIINIMAANVLATPGARASAIMILT